IQLRDAATGVLLRTLETRGDRGSIAFSADGRTLVAGFWTPTVVVWDVATGAVARTMTRQGSREVRPSRSEPPRFEVRESVPYVALSPDGKTIAGGGLDGTVRMWDLANGALAFELKNGSAAAVIGLAFSPDGKTLAVVTEERDDGTSRLVHSLRLW